MHTDIHTYYYSNPSYFVVSFWDIDNAKLGTKDVDLSLSTFGWMAIIDLVLFVIFSNLLSFAYIKFCQSKTWANSLFYSTYLNQYHHETHDKEIKNYLIAYIAIHALINVIVLVCTTVSIICTKNDIIDIVKNYNSSTNISLTDGASIANFVLVVLLWIAILFVIYKLDDLTNLRFKAAIMDVYKTEIRLEQHNDAVRK